MVLSEPFFHLDGTFFHLDGTSFHLDGTLRLRLEFEAKLMTEVAGLSWRH